MCLPNSVISHSVIISLLCTSKISLSPSSPHPPIESLPSPSPLKTAENQLSHNSLSLSQTPMSYPALQSSTGFTPACSHLPRAEAAKPRGTTPDMISQVLNRREESVPSTFQLHFSWCILVWSQSSLKRLLFRLLSTQSFFAKLPSSQLSSSLHRCLQMSV